MKIIKQMGIEMPNNVEVADVTRRLKSDNVKLMDDVRVILLASIDNQIKVNLTFTILSKNLSKPYASYEVDTVLDKEEIPQPGRNDVEIWGNVSKALEQNPGFSADDAWLQVAVGKASKKWKFFMEADSDSSFSFSIIIPGRSTPLEAQVQWTSFFYIV